MIKSAVLALLGAVIALAIYLYFHLGLYKSVEVSIQEQGPLHLLYKNHIGPYHQIVPTIAEVESWAKNTNTPCPKTYGEFLDNPEAVDQDRLRAHVGCVLSAPPVAQLPSGMTYEPHERKSYLVATWNGSPSVGPFKVYPKAKRYAAEHGLHLANTAFEIYEVTDNTVFTTYLFPLGDAAPK